MIDVSDGLSTDLGHLLAAGGVAAEIDAGRVPVHPDARRLARRTGRPALEHALHDGEDFELLFTLPAKDADRIDGRRVGGVRITRIGIIGSGTGAWLRRPDGRRVPLPPQGYQHEV